MKGTGSWGKEIWHGMIRRLRNIPALATVLGILAGVSLSVAFGWVPVRGGDGPTDAGMFWNLALPLGAILASAATFLPTRHRGHAVPRQTGRSERELINERYRKGADMLRSRTSASRMAGIYALEALAGDHPEESHVRVVDLLCASARDPAWPKAGTDNPGGGTGRDESAIPKRCPADVEAAVRAVGECRARVARETRSDIESGFIPNLRGVDLTRANLSGANLANAVLTDANLTGTYLRGANLTGASLDGANIATACLARAVLDGASGLTQEMLDGALHFGTPPASLPENLFWRAARAGGRKRRHRPCDPSRQRSPFRTTSPGPSKPVHRESLQVSNTADEQLDFPFQSPAGHPLP